MLGQKKGGQWDAIRDVFMQLQFKFKVSVNKKDPENKMLIFEPTALEVSQLNFFKGDNDMPMETMLAVSILNLQLDQLVKYL